MILYCMYLFLVCFSNISGMLMPSDDCNNHLQQFSHNRSPLIEKKKSYNGDWFQFVKQKAVQSRDFFTHQYPDPNTIAIGRFIYHIPALAALIDTKPFNEKNAKDIYEFNKILCLAVTLKPGLKELYENRARENLSQLAMLGYIPAQVDTLAITNNFNKKAVQHLKKIQDHIHEHPQYDEYDKKNYSHLLTQIEYKKTPLALYICGRSYQDGIGNMLSSEKAFEKYLKALDLADLDLKKEILDQCYKWSLVNVTRIIKLLGKLVDEEDEELQHAACNLFIKLISFEEKKINIVDLEKITQFTCDHYGVNVAKAFMAQNQGELFRNNNDLSKAIESYEQSLIHLGSISKKDEEIELWIRVNQNKLASLYADDCQINKAVLLFKANAEKGDEYAKKELAGIFIDSLWKDGTIIEKNDAEYAKRRLLFDKNYKDVDPIPENLFKQAITYLTELASTNAEAAGLLAKLYLGPKYNKRNCLRNICDWQKALYYAELAAQANNYYGLYTLFTLYSQGIHRIMKPDKEKALSFLIKGANLEMPIFVNSLIKNYDDDKNYEKAIHWIKKSLEKPQIESHKKNYFGLAYLAYYYALGITKESGYKPSTKHKNIITSANIFKNALENMVEAKITQEELEVFYKLQTFLNNEYIEYATNNSKTKIIQLMMEIQLIKSNNILLIRK